MWGWPQLRGGGVMLENLDLIIVFGLATPPFIAWLVWDIRMSRRIKRMRGPDCGEGDK
ncbi:unnamed protein product [marine sediment metagenome]|uniref:Uncharacterized protein n=1 Tax=marine sediment metagenome TaxID=412755 RepID=X0XN95_9ZZZZ